MNTLALLASLAAFAPLQPNIKQYIWDCEYITSDTAGHIGMRQMVRSHVLLDLRNQTETWSDVTVATAPRGTSFEAPQPQTFMNGFSYKVGANSFAPDFFKGFPPQAFQEKTLIWDVDMLEMFAKAAKDLKIGVDTPFGSGDVNLGGGSHFMNTDVRFTLIGHAKIDGKECEVMKYTALENPVSVNTGQSTFTGRSHYMGEIWFDPQTKIVERGTLFEDVIGENLMPNIPKAMVSDIVRIGTLTTAK